MSNISAPIYKDSYMYRSLSQNSRIRYDEQYARERPQRMQKAHENLKEKIFSRKVTFDELKNTLQEYPELINEDYGDYSGRVSGLAYPQSILQATLSADKHSRYLGKEKMSEFLVKHPNLNLNTYGPGIWFHAFEFFNPKVISALVEACRNGRMNRDHLHTLYPPEGRLGAPDESGFRRPAKRLNALERAIARQYHASSEESSAWNKAIRAMLKIGGKLSNPPNPDGVGITEDFENLKPGLFLSPAFLEKFKDPKEYFKQHFENEFKQYNRLFLSPNNNRLPPGLKDAVEKKNVHPFPVAYYAALCGRLNIITRLIKAFGNPSQNQISRLLKAAKEGIQIYTKKQKKEVDDGNISLDKAEDNIKTHIKNVDAIGTYIANTYGANAINDLRSKNENKYKNALKTISSIFKHSSTESDKGELATQFINFIKENKRT